MGNEERPKLSWREIDKRRAGGGSTRTSAPSERPAHGEETRQKQYRAALEAAFAKGELGKLADKLNLLGRNTPEEPKAVAPAAPTAPASAPTASAPSAPAASSAPTDSTPADADAPKKSAAKKKPPEDRASLFRKLTEAASRSEISRAAEKYLSRFPMPDDHEFLEQILEHEKESRIHEAMTRIGELLDRRYLPRRTRALIGKLRYLTETSFSDEIRELAKGLLARLS